jgi:ankyrin repeat protein
MESKLTKTVVECHAINTTTPHHHHIPLHHHRPSPSSPSPLSRSCVCGNLDAVAVLLDAGADLRMSTKKAGRTALHMAAAAGSPSVMSKKSETTCSLSHYYYYYSFSNTFQVDNTVLSFLLN